MTKQEFIDKSNEHNALMFELSHAAYGIVREALDKAFGQMEKEYLYSNPQDPDWIYLEDDWRVNMIRLNEDYEIMVDVWNPNLIGTDEMQFEWMNVLDKIAIADYIARM